MANTTANGEATGYSTGTVPPFVKIGDTVVNRNEVLTVIACTTDEGVDGIRIDFIQHGWTDISGVTVDGTLSLLNGDPF